MSKSKHIDDAMRAHTNLNVFGAIISILEGGNVYGPIPAGDKIIALCKKETIRQLRLMDAAVEKIGGGDK